MYVMAHPLRALAQQWEKESHKLRSRYAEEKTARLFQTVAEELRETLEGAQQVKLFNLQEASRASGYSADHLGRLVREGKIPNAGRANAPKIALRDLPLKAGHLPQHPGDGYSLTEARAERIADSIVSPEREGSDG